MEVEGCKTLFVTAFGGYDNLLVSEEPRPEPGEGEVLVRIAACGLNFAELMARMGAYGREPPLPAVLGMEASGIVVQAGRNVKNVKV